MSNKSFKRRSSQFIILFLLLIQLLAFQNCSGGLQTQDIANLKSGSESQSSTDTPMTLKCSPTLSQSCETESGYGNQFCTSAGVPQVCNLESCKTGYSLMNKTCVVNSCVANSTAACVGLNGTGTKTCNSAGTAYSACQISACNSGFNLQSGVCVANLCSPNSTVSCAENNGTGTKTCNSAGTVYSSCQITVCSSGYNMQNGSCVVNACVPNQTNSCTVSHGTGTQVCNAQGSAYESCKSIKCSDGYESTDGATCTQIKFKVVKVQTNYSCGITTADTVKCWGYNTYGNLGNNSTERSSTPTEVNGLKNVASIVLGERHACALSFDGTVKCWGGANRDLSAIDGSYSLLGDGSNKGSLIPLSVNLNATAVQIAGGNSHTCALISDGTVKCWGLQFNGALGTLVPFNSTSPSTAYAVYSVENLSNVKNIFSGDNSNCALTNDDKVKCWGLSFLDKSKVDFSPVQITALSGYSLTQISITGRTACILTFIGSVKCIGSNEFGQFGNNTTTDNYAKLSDSGNESFTKIASSNDYSCGVTAAGLVKCWGANFYGNLGNNTKTNSSTFVDVLDLANVKSISLNAFYGCALTTQNEIKCWGLVYDSTLNNNIYRLKAYQIFQ